MKQEHSSLAAAHVVFDAGAAGAHAALGARAYLDLEINVLRDELLGHAPGPRLRARGHIDRYLGNPLYDIDAIRLRQDAVEELVRDPALLARAGNVFAACDAYLHTRTFNNGLEGGRDGWRDELQRLENARLLSALADEAAEMGQVASRLLADIRDFGAELRSAPGFPGVSRFMREVYVPLGLGALVADIRKAIERGSAGGEAVREAFKENVARLIDAAALICRGEYSGMRGEREDLFTQAAALRKKLTAAKRPINGALGRPGKFNPAFSADIIAFSANLLRGLNGAIYEHLPRVDTGGMEGLLAFITGPASLHVSWAARGFPAVKPVIAAPREKKAEIVGSFNVTLMGLMPAQEVAPNDIISDRGTNLFIVTGPNNGGKTTYLRQAGQMHWMAQAGMLLPATKAALSMVDGIYTSFTGVNDARAGEGQYLSELSRVKEFIAPEEGPGATPFSLVIFDEFASGTDHAESVMRTLAVLRHLGELGTAAYCATHKHEIADAADSGALPGAMNLAPEVVREGDALRFTFRILRNAREKSYGHIQAEKLGITRQALRERIIAGIAEGRYVQEDTRAAGTGIIPEKG